MAAKVWHNAFSFLIEIDGVVEAAFTTCSDLNVELGVVKHIEGAMLAPSKSPGLANFPAITLTNGASAEKEIYEWFKATYDAASEAGAPDESVYRSFDIIQTDRSGAELERWRVIDCFPTAFSPGKWDKNAEEKRMQSVTLEPNRWFLVE